MALFVCSLTHRHPESGGERPNNFGRSDVAAFLPQRVAYQRVGLLTFACDVGRVHKRKSRDRGRGEALWCKAVEQIDAELGA